MKSFIRTLFVSVGLSMLAFTFSGCPSACEIVNVLCDLVNEFFGAPTNTITLGDAFEITADVLNRPSSNECDVSGIANATSNLFDVFFDQGGGNWVSIFDSLHNQVQLGVNDHNIWSLAAQFNQSGNYRLDYYSDFVEQVDERLENNNFLDWLGGIFRTADQSALEQWKEHLKTTNNYSSFYLTVLPSADGKTVIEGKPAFEVLAQQPWDTRVFDIKGK